MSWLGNQYAFSSLEDYYQLTWEMLITAGGGGLLLRFGGLYQIMCYAYPEVNWDPKAFDIYGKRQLQLITVLKQVFNTA